MEIPDAILAGLPSPCLVVDRATVNRNIQMMADSLVGTPVRLRPHFKAHKSTVVMRQQLAASDCAGVTCATAGEAVVLADGGFEDVLLAHEVADASNIGLAMRAAAGTRLTVAVDDPVHVDWLERAAAGAGVTLEVVVDIDVGMRRTGRQPDDPVVVEIARRAASAERLQFRGVFAYQGHVQMKFDPVERWALEQECARLTAVARDAVIAAGLPPAIVTGGGTGTYRMSIEAGVLDELQAGSYVFMDATYAKDEDLPFQVALFVMATVVSRPSADRAVINAGLKTTSVEKGVPTLLGTPGTVLKLSDEHGTIQLADGAQPRIGDRVLLIPSHVDPTINLHDTMFAWDAEHGVEAWAVDARRINA